MTTVSCRIYPTLALKGLRPFSLMEIAIIIFFMQVIKDSRLMILALYGRCFDVVLTLSRMYCCYSENSVKRTPLMQKKDFDPKSVNSFPRNSVRYIKPSALDHVRFRETPPSLIPERNRKEMLVVELVR